MHITKISDDKKNLKFLQSTVAIFVFFLVFFLVHGTGVKNDDVWFLKTIENYHKDYLAFAESRYKNWSSRFFIEFFLTFLVQHVLLWKILSAVLATLVVVLPVYFLDERSRNIKVVLVSFASFVTISSIYYNETGWIATSTNYLWPMSFLLIGIIPLAKHQKNKSTSFPVFVMCLVFFIFACNQEQITMAMLLLFTVYIVMNRFDRESIRPFVPYIAVIVISLIYIFFAPGSKGRYESEMKARFPDFSHLSFFQKFEIGYSFSLRELFIDTSNFTLLFLVLLMTLILFKTKRKFIIFPLVILIISVLFNPLATSSSFISEINKGFTKYGTNFSLFHPETWAIDVLLSLLLFLVVLTLIVLSDTVKEATLLTSLLLVGISTKMIMGFTPTVWASGVRTSYFMYISVFLLTIYLYQKYQKHCSTIFLPIACCVGFIGILDFLFFSHHIKSILF